jgi:hypothetical protein
MDLKNVSEEVEVLVELLRDVLGNEIRNTILSSGEKSFFNLRNVADRMGLRNAFTKDGVPLPTREADGVSRYPSFDINKPLTDIISKYRIFTGPVREQYPELVNVLGRYKGMQGKKGENAFRDNLVKNVTDMMVERQRPGANAATPMEGFEPAAFNEILDLGKDNLKSVLVCAIGYRSEEDNNQHLAKVRKNQEDIFEVR